jgi:hypothetical protein
MIYECRMINHFILHLLLEKSAHFLDKIAEFIESSVYYKDGGAAQFHLLKYAEDKAYHGKGATRKKKRLSPFCAVSWVMFFSNNKFLISVNCIS